MKSVLISIKPKYCQLIANGEKTIEVRKTRPKIETPFKCYIYCTKGETFYKSAYTKDFLITNQSYKEALERSNNTVFNGKVIGEFVCDYIDYVRNYGDVVDKYDCDVSCLSAKEIIEYSKDKNGNFIYLYGWHISDLKIYNTPKELWKFNRICQHKESCVDCIYSLNEARFCYDESVGCDRWLKRPPRSWCYVEEEQE